MSIAIRVSWSSQRLKFARTCREQDCTLLKAGGLPCVSDTLPGTVNRSPALHRDRQLVQPFGESFSIISVISLQQYPDCAQRAFSLQPAYPSARPHQGVRCFWLFPAGHTQGLQGNGTTRSSVTGHRTASLRTPGIPPPGRGGSPARPARTHKPVARSHP